MADGLDKDLHMEFKGEIITSKYQFQEEFETQPSVSPADYTVGGDNQLGQQDDSSPIQKKVEAELTCSICLCLFENPRALPCQHTYCENCIKALSLSSSANGRQVRCPECRKVHDIPEGNAENFKINYKISSLCDWMRGRQPGKCPSHLEEFDHICHVCKEPVCKKCTITTTHSGHDCVSMAQFAENMLSEVRSRKEALRKARQRVERNLSDLTHNKERAMLGLQQHMESIKHAIDQAQQHLADNITDAFHRKETNLKRQDRKLQSDLDDLEGLGREEVLQTLHESISMPASLPLMWNALKNRTKGGSYAPCENSTLMVEWDQALIQQLTQEIKFGEVKVKPLAVAAESYIEVKPVSPDVKDVDIILHLKDGLGADAQSDITADVVAMVYTPGGKRGQLCEIRRPPGGHYTARFSPRDVGKYVVEVKVTGDVVKNCPYSIMVEPSNKFLANKQTTPTKLYEPHDIKVLNGDYVIADKSNHQVIITDTDYNIKSKLPKPKEGRFDPYSIALNSNDILVTDNSSGRVVVYKDGSILKEFGHEELQRPTGIAVFKSKVYVVDWQQNCIQVFNLDGLLLKSICHRGNGPNQLNQAWMVTFNSKGQLLVADSHNKRIQIFEPDRYNEAISSIPVKFEEKALMPRGIAVDANDTIFVTAMERVKGVIPCLQCVVVFTHEGQILGRFGHGASFHFPRGIAVTNNSNNVPIGLVTNNHSIKEFEI